MTELLELQQSRRRDTIEQKMLLFFPYLLPFILLLEFKISSSPYLVGVCLSSHASCCEHQLDSRSKQKSILFHRNLAFLHLEVERHSLTSRSHVMMSSIHFKSPLYIKWSGSCTHNIFRNQIESFIILPGRLECTRHPHWYFPT